MEFLVLIASAFGAGVLNTVAGGGTFLTFPSLVFTGMAPVMANATSTVAVFPGYLGGALGFQQELGGFDRRRLLRLARITLAGGLVGSGLFAGFVQRRLCHRGSVPSAWRDPGFPVRRPGSRIWAAARARDVTPEEAMGLFAVALYGGYFSGGLGIPSCSLFSRCGG